MYDRQFDFSFTFSFQLSKSGIRISILTFCLRFIHKFLFSKVWYIYQFLFLFSKLGKRIQDFSFSSRNWGNEFRFLFLLSKLGKKIRDFSFSSRDEAKGFGFLFLFSKLVKGNSDFSFSSRMWRNCFQISLSLLDWAFLHLVNDWLGVQRDFFQNCNPP